MMQMVGAWAALAVLIACVASTRLAGWLSRAFVSLPHPALRIGCVDGLRGYLALAVMIHHFLLFAPGTDPDSWSAPVANIVNQLGKGSVALFFMATGLVFYPHVRRGFLAIAWRKLVIARLFRILPLVAFSVAIVLAVVISRVGFAVEEKFVIHLAKWLLAYEQPDLLGYANTAQIDARVLWSLYYEWIFYFALLPLVAMGTDVLRGRAPAWIVPAGFLLATLALRMVSPENLLGIYAPLFAIGMLAAELCEHSNMRRLLASRDSSAVGLVALVLAVVSAHTPWGLGSMMLLGLFFATVAAGNSLGGLLSSRGARTLGELSFGIYVLHGIAIDVLFTDQLGGEVIGMAGYALMIPLMLSVVTASAITCRLIERPAIRMGSAVGAVLGRPIAMPLPAARRPASAMLVSTTNLR